MQKAGKIVFPVKSTPVVYPLSNGHPWPFKVNIHATNIIQIEEVIVRNKYVNIYVHKTKEKTKLKESKEGYMGGFVERKEKKEKCIIIIIFNDPRIIKQSWRNIYKIFPD